jgi:hypothetical protein
MRPYYTLHTDDGHGWLAVPLADLAPVGLTAASFSHYSYRKADWFYLEEDCDIAIFMNAHRARFGNFPVTRQNHCNGFSPIRRMRRIA